MPLGPRRDRRVDEREEAFFCGGATFASPNTEDVAGLIGKLHPGRTDIHFSISELSNSVCPAEACLRFPKLPFCLVRILANRCEIRHIVRALRRHDSAAETGSQAGRGILLQRPGCDGRDAGDFGRGTPHPGGHCRYWLRQCPVCAIPTRAAQFDGPKSPQIGARVAVLALELVEAKSPPKPVSIVLDAEVVPRASTARNA
jgi:hypothetical protein